MFTVSLYIKHAELTFLFYMGYWGSLNLREDFELGLLNSSRTLKTSGTPRDELNVFCTLRSA